MWAGVERVEDMTNWARMNVEQENLISCVWIQRFTVIYRHRPHQARMARQQRGGVQEWGNVKCGDGRFAHWNRTQNTVLKVHPCLENKRNG